MQVRATLLGARHVPERLCGGYVYTWGIYQVFDFFNIKTCHASATAWHDISLLLRVIEQTLHSASSYLRHTGQQQAERHVTSSVTAAVSSAGHALYLQHAAVVS